MFKSLVRLPIRAFSAVRQSVNRRTVAVSTFVAGAVLAAIPASSLATETPTEEGIKTLTTTVSSEGVEIILAILTGLAALIVAVIVIPKGIALIKRFV